MNQTEISPQKAFIHVVYEYRCLVRAEYCFRNSHKIDNEEFKETSTIARNAVLAKIRSIIEFYIKESLALDKNITAKKYFGFSLKKTDPKSFDRLEFLKHSLEVHDLHLTVWRDPDYRKANNKDKKGRERQWIDWNNEQCAIVMHLIYILNLASNSVKNEWTGPFKFLHETCSTVVQHGGEWPAEISTEEKILKFVSP